MTAVVVAGTAYLVLDLSPSDALLVGAVVSSTDAAAVFAATRGIHLRERISALLELESGLNDPVAAVLVIFLVEMRTSDAGVTDAIVLFGKQAVIGAVVGLAAGAAAVFLLRRLPLPSAGLAPVLTTGIALAGYTGSAALGGSGLLSAYLAGLVVGNAHVPHGPVIRGFLQGAAWVAQIGLFVLLGLLVTPSRLFDAGFGPLIVAVALVVVARPLATAVCLAPLRMRAREIGFVAAAGLRGGVPIVFATFPIAAGLAGSERLFDVVFFVVVASVALQGLMLRPLARWLDVTEAPPPYRETSLHADALRAAGAELVEVDADHARHRRPDARARPGAAVGGGDRGDPARGAGGPAARDDAGRARRRALPAARTRPGIGRPRADRRPPRGGPGRVDGVHAPPVRAGAAGRDAGAGGIPRVPGAGLPLPGALRARPRAGRAEGRHAGRHARGGARHLGDPRSGDGPPRALLRGLGQLGRGARGDAEHPANVAYTRFVLDAGMAGDALDLAVALAPCTVGYGDIGRALAAAPATVRGAANPYEDWIATYSGAAYLAASTRRSRSSTGCSNDAAGRRGWLAGRAVPAGDGARAGVLADRAGSAGLVVDELVAEVAARRALHQRLRALS